MRIIRKTENRLFQWILIVIFLFTGLGWLKGIFVSLDIDESYAIAQSYRLACGDRMLCDMWEPHQLSAFLGAIFIKVYLLLGTTDYLLIYMRIVGMLIHWGMGTWMYHSLKSEFGSKLSMMVLLLHLNFLPKWLQVPEFEVMHYWFLLATFLLLYSHYQKRKRWWRLFGAGICLVGIIMCYPTMFFLYPVYSIGIYLVEKRDTNLRKCSLKSILWFSVGSLTAGLVLLVYLFSYQTPGALVHNVQYLFMDESHTTYTMLEKWKMYAQQVIELFEVYLGQLWQATVLVVLAELFVFVVRKLQRKAWNVGDKWKLVEWTLLCILVVTAILLEKEYIIGCLFEDENQFYGQVRYIAAIFPGIIVGIKYCKKMCVYFWLGLMPSVLSVPLVLLITNMNVNVTCAKAVLGIWISILMLSLYFRDVVRDVGGMIKGRELLLSVWGGSILAGFLVCRLILIRVTGCLPVTIMASLQRMDYGAEKGIYILEEQAKIWNENYRILDEILDDEDYLLYIGAETLIYLAQDCIISTPSTQGTTVFNEMFLHYYEEHPDKKPTVVVIDKTFSTNSVYALFSDASVVIEWLEEEYPNARSLETTYMKILFCEIAD